MTKTINIAFAIMLSLAAAGCVDRGGETEKERLQSVYTFRPEENTELTTSTYTSTVEEGRSISFGFKTGGQIMRLTVGEGDYVKKGQVVGYLDDKDYRLSLQQLETQYNQLSSELKRIEEMHRHNNVSDNDYEKAVAGVNQLKIQLELTRNKLSYTQLVAPSSGHIVKQFMEVGEMTGAGTPVFKIVDNSGVEAAVALSASAYSDREKIVRCIGKSPVTGDEEIPLPVIGFIPDGDSNSLFKLRLKIPDAYRDRLFPGMNLNVEILSNVADSSETSKIPSRALFERQGKSYVWVVGSDSTLTAREVTVEGAPEGKFSIVRGLDGDCEIVAAGVHHLSDGRKVKIIGNIDNLKDKAAL